MSGTGSLPASISITQDVAGPYVTIMQDSGVALPPGVPPYPLAADPSQTWVLQDVNGTLTWVQVNTLTPLTLSCGNSGNVGVAIEVTGTVNPPGDTVVFALGTSATVPPGDGFVEATNTAGMLSGNVTPGFTSTFYMWAIDQATGRTAVSPAITVGPGAVSLTVNAPGSAEFEHGASGTIDLSGALSPPQPAALQAALSTSNTAPPTSGWTAASLSAGQDVWTAYVPVPALAGSYYIWVERTDGAFAVVADFAITVT